MSVFNNVIEGNLTSCIKDSVLTVTDLNGKSYSVDVKVDADFPATNKRQSIQDVFCILENDTSIFIGRADSTFTVIRKKDKCIEYLGGFDYNIFPFKNEKFTHVAYGRDENNVVTMLSREVTGIYPNLVFEFVEGERKHLHLYRVKRPLPTPDAKTSLVLESVILEDYRKYIFLPKGDWRDYLEQIS